MLPTTKNKRNHNGITVNLLINSLLKLRDLPSLKKVFLLNKIIIICLYSQIAADKIFLRCNILSRPALKLFQFKGLYKKL